MTHFPSIRRALLAALAALGLAATARASAITNTLNYQGFLTDTATGLPIDTGKDMQFAVYNAATGGSLLFTESRCGSGNARVTVSKGRYQVELGSNTSGGIPPSVFTSNPTTWLEVRVDPDDNCAGFETLTPRVRLQAAPYSVNASYASTATRVEGGFAELGTSIDPGIGVAPLTINHYAAPDGTVDTIDIYRYAENGVNTGFNMGSRLRWSMRDNSNNPVEQVAALSAVLTDANDGAEKSELVFELMDMAGAGGMVERMRLDEAGFLGLNQADPQSRLHLLDGDIRISTNGTSRGIIFQDNTVQQTAPIQGIASAAMGPFAVAAGAGCAGQGTEANVGPVVPLTRVSNANRILAHGYLHMVNGGAAAQSFCVDLCAGTGAAACPCPAGPGNPTSIAYNSAYMGVGLWGGVAMNALFSPAALGFPGGMAVNAWYCVGHSAAGAVGAPIVNGEIVLTEQTP